MLKLNIMAFIALSACASGPKYTVYTGAIEDRVASGGSVTSIVVSEEAVKSLQEAREE